MQHDLPSGPASTIPSEFPSSKTLSNDPLSGSISHHPNTLTRDQLAKLDKLTDTVRQLQSDTLTLQQDVTSMKLHQATLVSSHVAIAQDKEMQYLRSELNVMRDRLHALEESNGARSVAMDPSSYPHPPLVNGRKRTYSFANGQGVPLTGAGLLSKMSKSFSNSIGRDMEMKDSATSGTPSNDDDDLSEMGTNAATSELATRHMVPSSVSESNGDVAGETVVIGATNTGTALEELGPGEANGGWGSMANKAHVFAKPSLPVRREPSYPNGLGESQTSEYIPSGVSIDTNATPDIRPASFVPLNRNHPLEPSRQRPFDSPPVLEGWDNSQDTDYRPSGDVSSGATRGTPEGARYRRGRGGGSGSRGDHEAIKFKNYSARLTEPAPWESEDWDGTTGATLIRSPSSRGRTVRQRGQSSTTRTLDFDTPTGVRKKLKGDSDPRPRDAAGRLLRANGMVDRRSERYHRKKTVPNTQSDASPLSVAGSVTPATPASAVTTPAAPNSVINNLSAGTPAHAGSCKPLGLPPVTPAPPSNPHDHHSESHAAAVSDSKQPLLPPATPSNNHQAPGPITESPKTHEDYMRRIFPKGRPVEEAVDNSVALR